MRYLLGRTTAGAERSPPPPRGACVRGGGSPKIVPAAGEDLFWPRSGRQKQCRGGGPTPHWARLSFLSEVLEETLVAKGGDSEGASEAITFSSRVGNQPPSPQQVEMGRGSPGGQYHRAGDGEVVWSLKRGIRMGDNREGRKQDRSYRGARSKCPPNSDVIPGSTTSTEGGWESGLARTLSVPRPLPSQSLTWLKAQPGPKEGSGRSSFHPPRLSVPSSRAPPAPLVAPPARRRLSERPWPPDRH